MLLQLIWEISLVLAVLSLGTMLILIALRLVGAGRMRRHAARRAALLADLLAWLEDGSGDDAPIRAALARDGQLAMELLVEVFEIVRGEGQARLAALAEEAGIGDRLRRRLPKGSVRSRLAAAEGLVWFPGQATTDALRQAVLDPNDDISFAAAATLAEFGSALMLDDQLLSRLGQVGSSRRIELVLGRLASQRPQALVDLVRDERRGDRIRAAALDALTQTAVPGILELILSLGSSPSTDIRVAVARNLGHLGHPEGCALIAAYLNDLRWEVRSKAAEAVGRIGAIELGPALCDLLLDENWWVRHRAGESLFKLGDAGIAALKEMVAIAGQTMLGDTAARILAERSRSA